MVFLLWSVLPLIYDNYIKYNIYIYIYIYICIMRMYILLHCILPTFASLVDQFTLSTDLLPKLALS